MLTIKIGNTYATLKDNSIPVVMRSPLFADEEKNGSYLFNFSVILTEELRKELGYINRPASTRKKFKKNVEIRLQSFTFSATANIKGVNNNEVELFLPASNGVLASMQKHINLREVDSGDPVKTFQYYTDAYSNYDPVSIYSDTHIERIKNISFPNITSDSDSLLNESGNTLTIPKSGTWYFMFNISLINTGFANMRLQILRDGTVVEEKAIDSDLGIAFFVETGSRKNFFKVIMPANAKITFRFIAESRFNNGSWEINYAISPQTTLTVFTNFALFQASAVNYPYSNYTVFPVYNNVFYSKAPKSRFNVDENDLEFLNNEKFPVINYFRDSEFVQTITGSDGTDSFSMLNTMVPFVYLPAIIKWILEKTDTTITGDNPFEDDDIRQLCCITMNAINVFDQSAINKFNNEFTLADLLPDTDIASFFMSVCKTLGIAFSYNPIENTISFRRINSVFSDRSSVAFSDNITSLPVLSSDQYDGYRLYYADAGDEFLKEKIQPLSEVNLKGSVDGYGDLPTDGNKAKDCFLVAELNEYYVWKYNTDTGYMSWSFYSLNYTTERKVFFDEDKDDPSLFEYVLPVPPCMMIPASEQQDAQFGAPVRKWKIPVCLRPGYFDGLPKPEANYSLLFYRAWRQDSNGDSYPLGSNDYTDYNNNDVTSYPLSLDLSDNENSHWKKNLERYTLWRAKTEGVYTFQKLISPAELGMIDMLRWHNINGVDYLIKEIRFNLSDKSKLLAEFDVVSRLVVG